MGAGVLPPPRAVVPQQVPQQMFVPQQVPQQNWQWRPSGGQNRFQNWRSPFVSAMGCYRCGDLNHFVRDCPQQMMVPQQIMGQQVMRPQMVPQQTMGQQVMRPQVVHQQVVTPQVTTPGVMVPQGVTQGGMQQVQVQQCGVEAQQVGEMMQGGTEGAGSIVDPGTENLINLGELEGSLL